MLNLPASCGWMTVSFGSVKIGSASYVQDVPVDCLDAFIQYFENSDSVFHLELDAEGYMIGVIEFDQSLYRVSTDTDCGLNAEEITGSKVGTGLYASNCEILTIMAKELIEDVRNELDSCIDWEEILEGKARENRKNMLLNKCNQLEKLIT